MPEHTPAPTPSRAVYGFTMYLSFKIFFLLYLIWAIVPEEWFRIVGITYLPKRHWAVTIPIFLLIVLGIFAFVIYPNMRYFITPNPNDLRTIRDCNSSRIEEEPLSDQEALINEECCCVNKEKCFKMVYDKCSGDFGRKTVPIIKDLNIWDVSEQLYLK